MCEGWHYLQVRAGPLQVLDLALDLHQPLTFLMKLLQLLLLLTQLLLIQLLPRKTHRRINKHTKYFTNRCVKSCVCSLPGFVSEREVSGGSSGSSGVVGLLVQTLVLIGRGGIRVVTLTPQRDTGTETRVEIRVHFMTGGMQELSGRCLEDRLSLSWVC